MTCLASPHGYNIATQALSTLCSDNNTRSIKGKWEWSCFIRQEDLLGSSLADFSLGSIGLDCFAHPHPCDKEKDFSGTYNLCHKQAM